MIRCWCGTRAKKIPLKLKLVMEADERTGIMRCERIYTSVSAECIVVFPMDMECIAATQARPLCVRKGVYEYRSRTKKKSQWGGR